MKNINETKYNYMLEQNKDYMDLTALSFGDRRITYEEMHDRIEKYVRLLYSKGVRQGDVIGICAYLLGIIHDPVLGVILAVIPGTLGCFMDSILGAVFERKDLLTNEHVNLIATITGALIGILLV